MPLVSPLTPLPAGILDRTRKGSFGPEDHHPRKGNVLSCVQAITDQLWVKHRRGEELTVRPGSLVSPQTLYTGRERRPNVTREPGTINGHASIQLQAAPANQRNWNLEVPYVSDLQIQNALPSYGTGVHREEEGSDAESAVSDGWRRSPTLPAPDVPASSESESTHVIPPASGYVTHPAGLPPPFDTSSMQPIGRTLGGDTVLRFPESPANGSPMGTVIPRPGTPRLPWQLLYEPPALRLEEMPALDSVDDHNNENGDSSPTDDWLPANPAAWVSPSTQTIGSAPLSNAHVERVNYNALFSNFITPVSNTLTTVCSAEAANNQGTMTREEREEGEIEDAQPLDPRLRVRADHVFTPVIGSGQCGALISRERYSSSPLVAATEPADDALPVHPPFSTVPRHSRPRDTWTSTDFLDEAEQLIQETVRIVGRNTHTREEGVSESSPVSASPSLPLVQPQPNLAPDSVTSYPDLVSTAPPLDLSGEPESHSPAPDLLFDLELDTDSLPDLVDAPNSSDVASSSEENSAASGDTVFVRTLDCLQAMEHIRCAAPTPERDPVARAEISEELHEWGRQQVRSQESRRCQENSHLLRPLREGMSIVRLYLWEVVDHNAMRAAELGDNLMPDFFVATAAERTLDLVSTHIGDGKRKLCNDLLVRVSPDGKRLRRLGGDALSHDLPFRTVIYAESRRLQDYLSPLITLRDCVQSFIKLASDLITSRGYLINFMRLDLSLNNSLPFLSTEENTKLAYIYQAFVSDGQVAVATELGALLCMRFRNHYTLARLLRSNVFAPDDYVPIEGLGLVDGGMQDAECVLRDAHISTCKSSDESNKNLLQSCSSGPHIPGPLAKKTVEPAWLLQDDSGHSLRSHSPADQWFRRDGSFVSPSPFPHARSTFAPTFVINGMDPRKLDST
ncbi:hypothetical protein B0H13DRAFT_2379901 [Mycena leptocephala]|nr:hypothetical protein B0H13DRAFT_2379901 [Mycena leptocephala]